MAIATPKKPTASVKLSANEAHQLAMLAAAENGRLSCFSGNANARFLGALVRKSMCTTQKRDGTVIGWEITELGRERCKSIY